MKNRLDSLTLAILAACMIAFMAFVTWWIVERDNRLIESELHKKWIEGYTAGKRGGR